VDVRDGFSDGDAAPAEDTVRTWVEQDFSVDIATLTAVEHGADEASQLWRGVGAGGESYAVKLSGGGTPAGLIVSMHLAEHGMAGVIPPLTSRHGRPWSDRESRRLSVVPWVSETRALEAEMSPAHWRSYGVLLAKVHAAEVTDELAKALPCEDHNHEQVASAARTLDSSLRLTVEGPADAGRTVDGLVRALAQEWCAPGNRVSTLLDEADRLGRDLQAQDSSDVV
jgi:spectinomycin phosphotransferase